MYHNAASRKVKLYSRTEILRAQGLEQIRRRFWNEKGEELCQDRELQKWKATAIHGVIDTSWTLKKTAILVMEADHLQDELLRQEGVSTAKKQQKAGTVDENVARTLNSHRQLLKVNETLCKLKDAANTTTSKKSKISQAEDAARSAMGELRQAQESLRKALENKRKSLGSATSYQQVTPEVAKSTREPTTEDLKGMLASVLKRTRSREEAQTPDSDNSDDSDSPPTSSSKEVQVQDSDETDER